jgi:acyl-CoA thioesterase
VPAAPHDHEFAFDAATASGPDGTVSISDQWNVAGTANGGYLLALGMRALAAIVPLPDPLTATGHYMSRPEQGPGVLETTLLGAGQSTATAVATLRQGGTARMHIAAMFGRLGPASDSDRYVTRAPPDLPPPASCVDFATVDRTGPVPEIFHRVEVRLHPDVAWPRGERSGRADITGWVRFRDRRPIDALSLFFFADGLPPAIFDLVPRAWVPTLELTVHVRHRPVDGWLRAAFRTTALFDGHLDEDGELWDDDGHLVAMSRQLARYRRPATDQDMR